MSYILDALRKSEQERQVAAGQSSGLLFPVQIQPSRNQWLPAFMIALILTVTGTLIFWLWPKPVNTLENTQAKNPASLILADNPTPLSSDTKVSDPVSTEKKNNATTPQKLADINVPSKSMEIIVDRPPLKQHKLAKTTPAPAVKKNTPPVPQKKVMDAKSANNAPSQPVTLKPNEAIEATPPTALAIDPLKDLPPLNITGYIHNEQGSLAIINDKLVREGEEIAPGLTLVKIQDNSAILSYKGYVFSR